MTPQQAAAATAAAQGASSAAFRARIGRIGSAVGIILILLAVVSLVGIMVLLTIADRTATSSSPDPLYLVTGARGDTESWLVAAPGILILLATVVVYLGELTRRGTWLSHDRTFLQGGSTTVDLVALPRRTHLAWLAAAIVGWLVVLVVPVFVELGGGWPGTLHEEAHHAAWSLLVGYGGLVAALAAVSAVSLLKKATYDARQARGAASIVPKSFTVRFWRWFSFRWRLELWIAGIAGGLLGSLPVAVLFWPASGSLLLAAAGIVLAALAIVLSLNAWRSGESLTRSESVS